MTKASALDESQYGVGISWGAGPSGLRTSLREEVFAADSPDLSPFSQYLPREHLDPTVGGAGNLHN